MGQIVWTSRAEEDLLEVWSYVAEDDMEAADRVFDDVKKACQMLSDNPLAGRSREELARQLRSFLVGRYIIFYRPMENGIIVIRVLHGARDLPELL